MGFYSIYKLIKDVIRTLFGNKVVKILLIILVVMFFLALQSTKVQATYSGDTNGYFDKIFNITQNNNTFNLPAKQGNGNIEVKLKSTVWNYSTIIVRVESASYCSLFVTNGNFKYDFTNNKFSSTDTLYYKEVSISNNIADFSSITFSSYNANMEVSWGAWTSDYYVGLYGQIYDKANNNPVVTVPTFTSNGFARDLTTPVEYTLQECPENLDYYVVLRSTEVYPRYYVVYSDNPLYILTDSNNPRYSAYYFNESTNYKIGEKNNSSSDNTIDLSSLSNITTANITTDTDGKYLIKSITLAVGNNFTDNGYYPVCSNYNIYDSENNLLLRDTNTQFVYPFFSPGSTDISNLDFNNLFVEIGDWDIENNPLYIHRLRVSNVVVQNSDIIYYYDDKTFMLDTSSKYYKQYLDSDTYYFSMSKSTFTFDVDKSYVLVLNNSNEQISTSFGLITKNTDENIFEAVKIDTGGLITEAEADHDIFLQNEEHLQDIANGVGKTEETINNAFNNTTISSDTESDIDTNLNFNNNNTVLENIHNGFFSRLTSILTNIFDYDLSEVDTITFPIRNQSIEIKSDMISAYIPTTLYVIIQAMWYFLFHFYLFKYLSNLYYSLKSGGIIDGFRTENDIVMREIL